MRTDAFAGASKMALLERYMHYLIVNGAPVIPLSAKDAYGILSEGDVNDLQALRRTIREKMAEDADDIPAD